MDSKEEEDSLIKYLQCGSSVKKREGIYSRHLWIWRKRMIEYTEALWKSLQQGYGMEGKLLRAVKSFYNGIRMCERIGSDQSGWF